MDSSKIVIVGAGLVGSLLATLLAKKGFKVDVFEKRSDPRTVGKSEGRSINLALSHRGIRALQEAGIFGSLESGLIAMNGRKMHDIEGNLTFQPYGKEGQFINSISREILKTTLINKAEERGVRFHFDYECQEIDTVKNEVLFKHADKGAINFDVLFGTDGAFSAVRKSFGSSETFTESIDFIDHGYKELRMPPSNAEFALEPDFLHIWPRGKFLLIALPNPDKSFTCTLFLAKEGDVSFESIRSNVKDFFKTKFGDVLPLIPDLEEQFHTNPLGSLVTIKCEPWAREKTLLLGDAAHAIVPFYGQGMNAGFEDCRLLSEQIDKALESEKGIDWADLIKNFAQFRKENADAIADLALLNFKEMRNSVADDLFLKRKKIEAKLQSEFPDEWIPLYSMVTFSDLPYADAMKIGNVQDVVMKEFLSVNEITDLQSIIERFNELKGSSEL